jgi:hypothetical protein
MALILAFVAAGEIECHLWLDRSMKLNNNLAASLGRIYAIQAENLFGTFSVHSPRDEYIQISGLKNWE